MQINRAKKRNKVRILISLALAVMLIFGGWLTYAYFQKNWPFSASANRPSTSEANTHDVNYDPPTEQEVKNSQDGKKNSQDSTDQPGTNDTTPSTKKSTSVGISYADIYNNNLEIRAFTNSVIEGTGTCSATVTMDGMSDMKVIKSSEAFIDASSTQCRPIYIPLSRLHSGTWKVAVTFSSPDHEGTSETVEVKVP